MDASSREPPFPGQESPHLRNFSIIHSGYFHKTCDSERAQHAVGEAGLLGCAFPGGSVVGVARSSWLKGRSPQMLKQEPRSFLKMEGPGRGGKVQDEQ